MRVVKEFPHPFYKITLFKSGHRFILKFDAGDLDFSYKFRDGEVENPTDVQALFNPSFLDAIDQQVQIIRAGKVAAVRLASENNAGWDEII